MRSDSSPSPYLCRMDTSRQRRPILRRLLHFRQTVRANLLSTRAIHFTNPIFFLFIYIYSIYDISLISYLLAFGHFTSELLIFGSVKLGAGSLSTFVVSSTYSSFLPLSLSSNLFFANSNLFRQLAASLIWMFNQYDFYVKS